MGCLGVHFAITEDEAQKLKSFKKDADRLSYLQEEIEHLYFGEFEEYLAQSDKAWDAIHRGLSDGDLTYDTGPHPLRLAVIGGEELYHKDDYIMSLKTPAQVKEVAAALAPITESKFKAKYDLIDEKKYGFPKSQEDRDYTWDWFLEVVKLYQKAAADNRYVLFTADQ